MSVGDDIVADIQTKAGALSGGFGCKKRIEYSGLIFRRNTRTVILNFDNQPVGILARANGDLPLSLQSVNGVVYNVGPDLVQSGAISLKAGQIRCILPSNANTGFKFMAQDEQRAIQPFM